MDILKAMGVSRSAAPVREFDGAGDRTRFGEKQAAPDQAAFASRFAELREQRESQRNQAAAKPSQSPSPAPKEDGAQDGVVVDAAAEGESIADAMTLTVDGAPEEALEDSTDAATGMDSGESDPTAPVAATAQPDAVIIDIAADAAPDADVAADEVAVGEAAAEPGSVPALRPAEGREAVAESRRTASAPANANASPAPAVSAAAAIAPIINEAGRPADTAAPDDEPFSKTVSAETPLPSVRTQKATGTVSGPAAPQPVAIEAPESVETQSDDDAPEILMAGEKKPAGDAAPKTEALIVTPGAIKLAPDALASSVSASEPPLQADAPIRSETVKTAAVAHAGLDAPEAARQIFASIRADKGGGVDLRLDPPDLGRVRIQFSFERSDVVVATVSSERGETLDLMRRHSADLARELQRAGFESVTLEFASGESKGSPSREASAGSSGFDLGDDVIDAPSIVYVSARADNRLDRLV